MKVAERIRFDQRKLLAFSALTFLGVALGPEADVDHSHSQQQNFDLVRMEVDSGDGFGLGLSAEDIVKINVPERLINFSQDFLFGGPEPIWRSDESQWIQKRLEPLFGPMSRDDISSFLLVHHNFNRDIPSIAMYHKDAFPSLLKDPEQPEEEKSTVKWYRILWAIQELHHKWLLFQKKKLALQAHYQEYSRKFIHDDPPKQLFQSLMESFIAAESEKELKDVNSMFDLHFPSGEGQAAIDFSIDSGVSKAKNRLLTEYGRALFNKVSMAPPYQRNETAPPRVMACCWGPGDPATTLVMLDSCGEILDVLCTGPLSWESLTWTIPFFDRATQLRMDSDQERMLKFVTDHQPDVAIIGAANMSCLWLREQLLWVSDTMMRKPNSRASPLRIVYGDESLARLYEYSDISSDQLPGQSGIVKRAVALGRYLQNSLAMVATLCGAGREILSWKLLDSPDENFLNPDEKYAVIEQVMIDVTNQVGLDINLAINHEWLFAPLQFISGLGPIKAASLQRSLVKSGEVSTRSEFATLHGLGKRVYRDAVGFFRVRLSGTLAATSSSCQFIALLDDTRIHPELYSYAENMAQDVYGDMDLVQSIRDLPSYIQNLDIEAYARSKGWLDMIQCLCLVKEELIQGFKDCRKKYEELSDDDKFYMMTGGARDTLSEGSIVQATVRRVLPRTTICTVGAGLMCILRTEEWGDILKVGDTITCKIKSLQKKYWEVKLSSF